MPHINRLRVNNVKYNFGTQYYDDFMMKPYGKNMLYDLANGGGKSVLMLLLLQTVIPNCTLDDKQPVEKLFRTSQGSSTIHSLIEWKLNDNHIDNGFQYMTTGFCARKGTAQEEKDTASIDYFNYCIFYREYNDNDIRNLPLVDENERVTYSGLKQYLKELQRNPGLRVEVFDRKGEYQQFISNYGIYESEWEIIRGINKTEGHVRTYFETNYKTTRKVVEDLLIEEIIQKSYRRYMENTENEDMMAGTLLSIKDKLVELSQKRATVSFYDKQTEIIDSLNERLSVLDHVYTKKEQATDKLHKAYALNSYSILMKKDDYDGLCKEQAELDNKIKRLEIIVQVAKLRKEEDKLATVNKEIIQLEKEITLQEQLLERKKKEISLKESMNDYLEYLKEKSNRDELKESLDAIKGGSKVEIQDLNALAYNKKLLNDEYLAELEHTKNELSGKLTEAEKMLQDANEEERNLDIEKAIKQNAYTKAEEELISLKQKINEMRKQVSLLFLEELANTIAERQNEIQSIKDKVETLDQDIVSIQEKTNDIKSDLCIREDKKEKLHTLLLEYEGSFAEYKTCKSEYEKLLQVYHIISKDTCMQELDEQYKELFKRILRSKDRIQVNEKYLNQLIEKNLDVESEEYNEVKEYLEKRYKDQVMTGTAYLQLLEEKDRAKILKKIPMLPYSLIVMSNYEQLLEDRYFRRKDFGSYAIPILNLEEIKKDTVRFSKDAITFAMKDEELFYNEERMAEEASIVRAELEEEKSKLREYENQEDILKNDMETIRVFLQQRKPKYHEKLEQYEEFKKQENEATSQIEQLLKVYESEKKESQHKQQERSELVQLLSDKEEEFVRLQELSQIVEMKEKLEEKNKTVSMEYEELCEQYDRVVGLQGQWQEKRDSLKKQVESVDKQVENCMEQWTTVYSPYYVTGEFERIVCSREEIDARFIGKKDAFEKEYSDLGDKERLLNSYINAMNRSLKAIAKRKISVAMLEDMKVSHTLELVSEDVLQAVNAELVTLEQALTKLYDAMDKKKASMHQLNGKVEQVRNVAKETYGDGFDRTYDTVQLDVNIEEQNQALQSMQQIRLEMQEKFVSAEKRMRLCDNAKEDMDRVYRQLDIEKVDVSQAYQIEGSTSTGKEMNKAKVDKILFELEQEGFNWDDIDGFVKKLVKEFDLIEREMSKKRDEFYQQIMKTAQTLELLKAYELADELRTHVKVPTTLEESSSLKNNLNEVCDCIKLEKTRVEQGLEDMERIKQSFENQCLQRCDNVKTSLERLPKLSKIVLDNEQIPMIGLTIPYVSEELKQQRMSEYIDSIVSEVDRYDNVNDKMKYIKSALSLKRLFAVIVSDMNRIKLTLYKRERIKEQSRHLRYEEAVGSTGQSQGIYIQFLIGIINYITYMNSGNIDNTGLRKVIFIDNPFGAAKDVYIWEPIFELLKMNQVQLIVPARGTTPAITGKFDVNYILGQRLNDKKQQTVVVDYHSNVDTNEIEYIPLQYEQTSLFE